MISIIVPVYKAEAFLSQCVDSILQQTYGQYELILVDDGYADNCPAMCDEALAPDKEMFCEQIKLMHLNQAYYAIQIMRRQLLSRPIKEMQRIISEIVSHPSLDRSIMDRSLPHIMQLQFRLIQHKNAYTLYWLNWLMEKRRLWRQRNER
ncbi:MAG: glycosyltransferase [Clostridia bacterium]